MILVSVLLVIACKEGRVLGISSNGSKSRGELIPSWWKLQMKIGQPSLKVDSLLLTALAHGPCRSPKVAGISLTIGDLISKPFNLMLE